MDKKNFLKNFRSFLNFWIPEKKISFLHKLRLNELIEIRKFLPNKKELLEIGAGSGFQAKVLESWGFKVKAVDLDISNYRNNKLFDIKLYDGVNLPFDDSKFSIIFSSNVFEHIDDINQMLKEIARVSKKNATIILLMPSSTWRIWTSITDFIKHWHSRKHGVHSSNFMDEIYYFSRSWWMKKLSHIDYNLEYVSSNNIFYTGNSLLGDLLPIYFRKKMAIFMGSSCNVYILKKIN